MTTYNTPGCCGDDRCLGCAWECDPPEVDHDYELTRGVLACQRCGNETPRLAADLPAEVHTVDDEPMVAPRLLPPADVVSVNELGTVSIQRHINGTRTVLHADPVIRVATTLLNSDLDPDVIEEDGVLRLDTAGQYRYRFVRNDGDHWRIYERITEDQP